MEFNTTQQDTTEDHDSIGLYPTGHELQSTGPSFPYNESPIFELLSAQPSLEWLESASLDLGLGD